MSAANWFQGFYLNYLSRPRHERVIYRAIRKVDVRSMVEIGVGNARRTQRLLELALKRHGASELKYAAIDLFEGRSPDAPGVPLKQFHKLVKSYGVQTILAPGDPLTALARTANALVGCDLLIISADQDPQSLAQAWFYVPRMLHDTSLIFVEERKGRSAHFRKLSRIDVERLAQNSRPANDSKEKRAA